MCLGLVILIAFIGQKVYSFMDPYHNFISINTDKCKYTIDFIPGPEDQKHIGDLILFTATDRSK